MSTNGQTRTVARAIPNLQHLPRPLYGRAESLHTRTQTQRHSHPWVQLSYAIQGVLEVHTDAGRFIAPPQWAIWVPAHMPHQVFSSPRTEMRSLYVDASACTWADPTRCRVLQVTALTRELIRTFASFEAEYPLHGHEDRLVQVLLDQLQSAPEAALSLPWPNTPALLSVCQQLHSDPSEARGLMHWSRELGICERTLSRHFHQQTGLGFRAWRQRLRLFSALPMLERGERVTDVALACGYDSLSAFIAAFREQFSQTPGELFRHPTA
jgi:AraC-like DNA-binding protein